MNIVPRADDRPYRNATPADGALLSVDGLGVGFETRHGIVRAVDGVSFAIRRGETFALLGESGSGKSMTALAIMRLLPGAGHIDGGRVLLDGADLAALPESAMRAVRGRRIAMIFQEPMTSLNPVLTVGEQIAEVVRLRRGGGGVRQAVLELLTAVGIADPDRRHDDYPHQLSGGMKQRVMIAIALAGDPDLLIADEPTTALDVTIQAQVLELLKTLQRERGMALLLITHDLGVVAESADRVAVMYAGRIVEQATAARFFAAPAHPYSRKLFESQPDIDKRDRPLAVIPGGANTGRETAGCRFAARCEFAWEPCRESEPGWMPLSAEHMVRCYLHDPRYAARAIPAPATPSAATRRDERGERASSPLLEVRDLAVHYPIRKGILHRTAGHVRAVDGVSFGIARGRTLALVGESGCGKTTIGKALLRLVQPTTGRVSFDGRDLASLGAGELRRSRADLQIIFQDPYSSMNPRMRVGGIVEEGMITLGLERSPAARRAKVAELLRQVGLDPAAAERWPHEFSGGQRQRICIARALAVRPRLLVCDEPTSALDISVQAQILNLLRSLQEEIGLAYLFITHNLSVVSWLADEVAVMYLGRIVERGRVDEVLGRPAHPYTQALLAAVPVPDPGRRRDVLRLPGEPPSPSNPPPGCHFHQRCPKALPECRERYPGPVALGVTHEVRCFLYGGGAS